jgi:hypothetical protein
MLRFHWLRLVVVVFIGIYCLVVLLKMSWNKLVLVCLGVSTGTLAVSFCLALALYIMIVLKSFIFY